MGVVPELLGKETIQPVIRVRQGRGDVEPGAAEPVGADGHQERFGRNPSAGEILKSSSDQVLTRQEEVSFHVPILTDEAGNNQTGATGRPEGRAAGEVLRAVFVAPRRARAGFIQFVGRPLKYFGDGAEEHAATSARGKYGQRLSAWYFQMS